MPWMEGHPPLQLEDEDTGRGASDILLPSVRSTPPPSKDGISRSTRDGMQSWEARWPAPGSLRGLVMSHIERGATIWLAALPGSNSLPCSPA